jgi:hypothetical protein
MPKQRATDPHQRYSDQPHETSHLFTPFFAAEAIRASIAAALPAINM